MDVASVPRSVQVDTGKIGVKKMTVERKKTAAPTIPEERAKQQTQEVKKEQPSEEQIKQEAANKQAEEKARAEQIVEHSREVIAGKMEYAKMTLRILSGGDSTINILSGQEDAEYSIANQIQDPRERQQKIKEIQSRYQKLMSYAETRQRDMVNDINRLKKSEKPENRALAMDIEIFRNKEGAQSYQRSINNLDLILKTNIDPMTREPLSESRKTRFQQERDFYQKEMDDLIAKNGEAGKEGLINQREQMRDEKGGEIPHILDSLALVLTDGTVGAQALAKKDPVAFLENVMAKALTNKEEMNHLADNLVTSTLLIESDKAKFIKDMELGLSKEEMMEMVKNIGGKTTLGFLGVLSMLGYVAWKRSQENGGGQMMG